MENIRIESIHVTARPGTNSNEGIKDCIELSLEKDCEVKFFHNNSCFIIDSKIIMRDIRGTETRTTRLD